MGIIISPKVLFMVGFLYMDTTYWTYFSFFNFLSTQFRSGYSSYLGLIFGLSSVFVGQISTLMYYNMYNEKPVNERQLKLVLSHFSN